MNTFDEFDEQTDFSFLSLEESAPVAVTPKKSRSVQIGKTNIGIKLTFTFSDKHRANMSKAQTGKKDSPETVAKRAASMRVHWREKIANGYDAPHKQKSVMTPAGVFSSRREAAKFFNVSGPAIGFWMTECPQQFYYITKD